VADVVTARKRVELQVRALEHRAGEMHAEAERQMAAGREDAARDALQRRAAVLEQAAALQPDLDRLLEQERRLQAQVDRLEVKVEAFRSQKETLKAGYSAAEAHTRIGEAWAGISEEGADVGLALQRARERTEAMQARADAAEQLAGRDAPALPWETAGESAERQLAAMTAGDPGSDVEAELARLRGGGLAQPATPRTASPEAAS
jgi:phage shock protein A